MSGHSDFGIFNNFGALPFWPEYKQILRPLLVLRTLAIWIWPLLPSFETLMILVLYLLHKIQNHLLQCRLGVQLDPCIFDVSSPIRHFSTDSCPSVRQNELLRPPSLLHRSLVSYFWLLSSSTPEFSPIFPFLVRRCFCCKYLHCLRHRNKFVYRIVML